MAGARGPARRKLVDRLFGVRNRRRARELPAWTPRAWRVALRLAPLGLALAVWPSIRDAARSHPYFAVQEVAVRHHGRLSASDIRAAAGVEPGTSIWDVRHVDVEARLERTPWVRSARVWRELPHRVVLQVREYRPAAIVALNDPSPALFYVASNGRIFARLEPRDSHDYPYVTGLSAADLSGEDAFGPGALHRALALLRLVARDSRDIGLALAGVSEVHIDRVAGVTLLPMRPSLPIELGSGDFSL